MKIKTTNTILDYRLGTRPQGDPAYKCKKCHQRFVVPQMRGGKLYCPHCWKAL